VNNSQKRSQAPPVKTLSLPTRGTDLAPPNREGGNCPCWFGTLWEDLTRQAPEPPPTFVPEEAGPLTLAAAKRDVSLLYQPLKPWQTRIITLFPGKINEQLRCKIWTAEIIDRPGVAVSGTSDIVTYNALSYSWGSGAPTKVISCNGRKALVNDSLASALADLRDEEKEVRIWCDALSMYPYRTATKHLGNLRFMPQFSEGFDFVSERKNSCSVLSRLRLNIVIYAPNFKASLIYHFSFRKRERGYF
jgi:hypothetical protein